MKRVWPTPSLVAVLAAVVSLGWTGNNEAVSLPALDSNLVTDAGNCALSEDCTGVSSNIRTHWISRTHSGNLFLVLQADCQVTERCASRFVERTAGGTATRLNIEGQFRVLNSSQAIPDVQTWRTLSDSETEYTRYSWKAGAYQKVETHSAYRVDGVECGSALECYQTANKAYAERNTGRALKIWEKVHKVSWI